MTIRAILRFTAAWVVLVFLIGELPAQQRRAGLRAGDYVKTNPDFLKVFRPVIEVARKSTVKIVSREDSKPVALGTVVGSDGLILTKASEIGDEPIVVLRDGRRFSAEIVGVHEKHDLALLKIPVSGLTPVQWKSSRQVKVGAWAVSVGTGPDPIALGVVSVATRNVKPPRIPIFTNKAFLGVQLSPAEKGAMIEMVQPKTAAAKAGLRAKDIILEIAGKKIDSPAAVSKTLMAFNPGDEVTIRIRRGEKELSVTAKLGTRPRSRGDIQNAMGSRLSKRRTGFPVILQHDSVVPPDLCGGPLVDLDGKVIGINIARAGRTESYAIPSEVVQPLVRDMLAGKYRTSQKKEPSPGR